MTPSSSAVASASLVVPLSLVFMQGGATCIAAEEMLKNTSLSESIFKETCFLGSQIGFLEDQTENYADNILLTSMRDPTDMERLAKRACFSTVLPVDISEQEVVSKHTEYLRQNSVSFLLSEWEVISLCNEKDRFYGFMREKGFESFIPKSLDEVMVPSILKKKEDEWGKNCFLVLSEKDKALAKEKHQVGGYIVQEYVLGDHEYASHVLFSRGEIRYVVTFKSQHESDFYVQGIRKDSLETSKVKTTVELVRLFTDILRALNYEGIACFDYKIGQDGVPKIFEINPRIGASLGVRKEELSTMLKKYQVEAKHSNL